MSLIIPLELIYLCIAASRDCLPALLQVSLVSKECASEARKYVFKEINLDRRDRTVDAYSHYIQTLVNLLESNRMLGNYVRALVLPLEPSIYAASEVYTQDIPTILKHFTFLTMLSITPGDNCDWEALPDPLKQSISLRCSASSITRLNFANFLNFPRHLFQSAPNLTTLGLIQLSDNLKTEARSQSGPPAGRSLRSDSESRLASLTVLDASSVVHSCTLTDPKWISKLRNLSWHISTQEDLNLCCRIIRECAGSLRELTIDFQFVIDTSPIYLGDILSLPQVTKLTLKSFIQLENEIDGGAESNLEIHLPLFLDIIRSQRSVQLFLIEIKAMNPSSHITSSESAAPPAILRNRGAWNAMDDYLSSETTTRPIATILNFTIGLGNEQHRLLEAEEIAFKNQLLQETHEVLHRTIKAERLWMIIDDEHWLIPARYLVGRPEAQ
ncbi:hypothetical protein DFP72DRAFT_947983 [Ephemerocybe angulata]|uniref:F-box domain-containing protein n=1 Tax=Ephemerocybe angulata TaxID=980116 RepID=A0A8H6LTX3_9AGAR|nr:hypothetical protein DFP72DRAFT_947983 [Tulosesus angulatus]